MYTNHGVLLWYWLRIQPMVVDSQSPSTQIQVAANGSHRKLSYLCNNNAIDDGIFADSARELMMKEANKKLKMDNTNDPVMNLIANYGSFGSCFFQIVAMMLGPFDLLWRICGTSNKYRVAVSTHLQEYVQQLDMPVYKYLQATR